MILGRVLRVIKDGDLGTFLEASRTPAGFSTISFLIEGDELIFDEGHALPQMRRAFATDLVFRHHTDSRQPILDKPMLPAVLDNESCGAEYEETAVESPVREVGPIGEVGQESDAEKVKGSYTVMELGPQHLQVQTDIDGMRFLHHESDYPGW